METGKINGFVSRCSKGRLSSRWLVRLATLLCLSLVSSAGAYTPVEKHGRLHVESNRIVDQNGETVTLRGMCLFWSQWVPFYWNADVVETLAKDWKSTVIRACMGIEMGGYLENPTAEMAKMRTVVNACLDQGIYVIVDWHDHHASSHTQAAREFFSEIAREFGHHPNILYELYNEPLGGESWASIKSYSEQVIASIRESDPDNVILVNTPEWDLRLVTAMSDPVSDVNCACVAHVYVGSQFEQWIQDEWRSAVAMDHPVFLSEWGISEPSGGGVISTANGDAVMALCDELNIGWTAWSITDKDESSAALLPGTPSPGDGRWDEGSLTESGRYFRT